MGWNDVDLGLADPRTPRDFRCIECGGQPRLTDGREIYPHRADLAAKSFYKCGCGAYAGCHPDTTTPLGYPCGAATRKARGEAHAVIDPIWRQRLASRPAVYADLARRLDIPRDECHVAWMDAARAREAARAGREMRADFEARARR